MRRLVAVLLATAFLVAPPAQAVERVPAGTTMLLSNFDTWDSRWAVQEGKNVVWVSGGQLVLGLDMDPAGWVRQARVDTELPAFTYGTLRVRMRFLGPKGAHAAFWAQSYSQYCTDGCTEIDVAEHFGTPRVWQNLYWCPCSSGFQERQDSTDLDPAAWHYYKVDWTPSGYTFSIDGTVTAVWTVGLSNKMHFLTLTYLISDWERADLDRDHLGQYRAYVDLVELKANAWTEANL